MQVDPTQILRLIVLTWILAAFTNTHRRADDAPPAEALKRQGLKRSAGSTWVLTGEAVIQKDARTARNLSVQLRSAQEQQQALARTFGEVHHESNESNEWEPRDHWNGLPHDGIPIAFHHSLPTHSLFVRFVRFVVPKAARRS
jgi:hypothetical protein